jgi:hypothetical protein
LFRCDIFNYAFIISHYIPSNSRTINELRIRKKKAVCPGSRNYQERGRNEEKKP